MYQHIQSQTFLLNNGLLDMFRNARAVVVSVEITLFKIRRRGYESPWFAGKEPIVVVGHAGDLKRTLGFSTHFIDIRTLTVWAVIAARRFLLPDYEHE